MSLPTSTDPSAMRAPTHTPLDVGRLSQLATKLQAALEAEGAETLTPDLVELLAADLGVPEVHVYAAAAMLTEIACDTSEPVRLELCIGGCQAWGAAEVLDHLLLRHAERREAELPNYGIVAKRCLDKCRHAPVVQVHTPDGSAGISEANPAKIDEALEQLFEQS